MFIKKESNNTKHIINYPVPRWVTNLLFEHHHTQYIHEVMDESSDIHSLSKRMIHALLAPALLVAWCVSSWSEVLPNIVLIAAPWNKCLWAWWAHMILLWIGFLVNIGLCMMQKISSQQSLWWGRKRAVILQAINFLDMVNKPCIVFEFLFAVRANIIRAFTNVG